MSGANIPFKSQQRLTKPWFINRVIDVNTHPYEGIPNNFTNKGSDDATAQMGPASQRQMVEKSSVWAF